MTKINGRRTYDRTNEGKSLRLLLAFALIKQQPRGLAISF